VKKVRGNVIHYMIFKNGTRKRKIPEEAEFLYSIKERESDEPATTPASRGGARAEGGQIGRS